VGLILLVDDDPVVQRIVSLMLTRRGHEVTVASDGLEALDRLAERRPDMLVSDVDMPGMNGFDLVGRLRADERYRSLPILMLTASGRHEDWDRAREIGADELQTKPVASRDLSEAVDRLLPPP
jgi:chemosensory pili system protein ChpA (sensor histidine kinase/response regulator)